MPLLHELTIESAHAHRDRQAGIIRNQHCCPEEIVPDECEDQHGKRCDGWFHQRQHQVPKNLEFIDALQPCRLDQLKRQRLHEIAHEQGAEAGLKGRMEHDEARNRIDDFEPIGHVDDRQHQNLERHEIARNKDEEQRQRPAKFVDRQRVTGEAGKRHGHNHCWQRDDQCVDQVFQRIGLGEHFCVVRNQLKARWNAEHITGVDIHYRANGRHEDGEQR